MGKVKRFFKTLFYSAIFFIGAIILMIIYMFSTEGEKIDKYGLNRGFVKQSLNVRAGAGTEHGVINTLSPGDSFYVADTLENGWMKMILGSNDGSFSSEDESYAFVSGNFVHPYDELENWSESNQKEQDRLRAEAERQRNIEAQKSWNRTSSHTICKDFVKARLKSPSTAEFPSITKINIFDTGTNKFMVKGYVDAQNSFGAMIRSQYECEVELENETWSLKHIDIFD